MSLNAPTLGDTYTLMELPRTPDLQLSQRVVVAESQKEKQYSETETIDLGISKSIIASYVLKPTPKLVWSYPLSPGTLVDCMDVKTIDQDSQVYAIGLTERKKSRLLLLQRTGSESTVSAELELPKSAVAVKFSSRNGIYMLLKNGEFLIADYTSNSAEETGPQLSVSLAETQGNVPNLANKSTRVEFHTFIPQGSFNHKNDLLFYAVRSTTSDNVVYRLVALNHSQSYEIYQVSHNESPAPLKDTCTYSQGMFYVYDASTKQISSRSLMKPQEIVRKVSVASLLKDAKDSEVVSLDAVASDRLLLSHKSSVFLINFKFESLLSEHTNNSGNHVYLGFALPVEGTSPDSATSFALYLNLEKKTKLCKLKSIQVEVGLNLLSESLGKALTPRDPVKKNAWSGVPHLAESDLAEANTSNVDELNAVYKKLTSAVANKDDAEFNASILGFLKSQLKKGKSTSRFSATSDRIVDHKFIESVVALILSLNNEDKTVQVIDEEFFPKPALAYLLAHPLFPVKYTHCLLVLLSALNQPDLLRQAIQNCSALSLDELMTEFTNLMEVSEELEAENTDDVVFVSDFLSVTIDRILHDYSLAQITSKLSEVLTKEYESDNKRLERMLNVLINVNTNSSWTFVQAVIDVGGLFNWTVPTISALSEVIDSKVEALASNSYNLTLTNQALIALEQKHQKKSKKTEPKVVDNIHEIANRRAQLDALLTMSNNTANKKLLADEGVELAKQIPTYSREKLIF